MSVPKVQADWDLLRRARLEKGFTQQQLADAAGIALRRVNATENGNLISRANLQAIAKALDPKATWKDFRLLGGDAEEASSQRDLFLVDFYERRFAINPAPLIPRKVRHGSTEREVVTNNIARISETVKFSRKNRNGGYFKVRYTTKNNGHIGELSEDIARMADPIELEMYEEFGTHLSFQFLPKRGETYSLAWTVMKGFDKGQRDLHIHVTAKHARFRMFQTVVDLSGYLNTGHRFSDEPVLHFYKRDRAHATALALQEVPKVIEAVSTTAGIYIWRLNNIEAGLISCAWDFAD